MAISSNIGSGILKGLTQGATMTFSTPYLGLFTTMPDASGIGGEEVSYPEYSRVKINVKGVEGKDIMTAPYTEAGSGDDAGKTISCVKNQEIIYFPEAETGAGGQAVGFGLFAAKEGGTPYLWGELKTSVPINQNSVPMFRIEDFEIKVK